MDPTHPTIGEETVPPDEAEHIRELIAIHRTIQERTDRQQVPSPRNLHPKQHGCLRAELMIDADIPERFRHGIFRQARVHPALVRFSNSKQRDDRLPDAHGMAIKVFDVEGEKLLDSERHAETQDFVLVDHPIFFARNAADMLPLLRDFRRLMTGGPFERGRTILKAMLSRDRPFRIMRKMVAKRPHSPLDIRYWSTTPYHLDRGALKYSARPQQDLPHAHSGASADRLRQALAEHLSKHEARFDFLIQEQLDPLTMPIEDATIEWKEQHSPYRRVATLRIPRQEFESPEKLQFGEDLSFSPWHALPAHRPLGVINRVRKELYEVMSAHRHEWNQRPHREPTLAAVNAVFPPT